MRLGTYSSLWLSGDTRGQQPVDDAQCLRSVKVQERMWVVLQRSGLAMFASPRAFVLYHRERLAVLLSSALFLAGALPLFWAIA